MAKGVWLRRQDAFLATGLNVYQLDKLLRSCNRKMLKKTKFFFILEDDLTESYRLKAILVDEEDELPNLILNELNDSVDFSANDILMLSINLDLKKARKLKIIRLTKLILLRLGLRKRLLFYNWSERFFECFSNHFGRLKNNIVELHLNELQVIKFNNILDTCLKNMELNLNEIWDLFQHLKLENE